MIPLHKMKQLPPGQRRRKLVLFFEGSERGGCAESYSDIIAYAALILEDSAVSAESARALAAFLSKPDHSAVGLRRLCNTARHALLEAIGTPASEWDLIMPGSGEFAAGKRFFSPGMMVYAEDIRSPFNLGSIFRTAEAFGAEKVLVSPLCAPPEHPRAVRSAMGCIDYVPWERRALEELPDDLPVFALETGGTDIADFKFPSRGIVIIGSEELGVSPEALCLATAGRVSIPMRGIKASINVGVAFGILMQEWSRRLGATII